MIKEKVAGYRVSYAQNREDVILSVFFENVKKGFYVDVGAHDPVIESVTKYFYERGWSGINIEPQSVHFKHIQRDRKRDINLNIAVGSKAGKLTLRQYKGDGLSTLSPEIKAEYASHPNDFTKDYIDAVVQVKTLANIFSEHQVETVNFMKVDVEGYEYEVLVSNDWSKYRPQVICIEADHIKRDWHALLKENNYRLVFSDGLNEYFTDNKNPDIEKKFSYVKSILFGKPFVTRVLANAIYELNEKYAQETNRLNQELASSSGQVLYLQNELDEISSLKAHIKKFTRKKLKLVNHKIEHTLQTQTTFQPDVPTKSDNLLVVARESDAQNLLSYNQSFTENTKVRLYRKAKRLMKRAVRGKKASRQ